MYTRASLTDILARKSERVGQVGEDSRRPTCPARGNLNAPRHADFRAEVGEEVRVAVGPMEFKLNATHCIRYKRAVPSDAAIDIPAASDRN